MQMKLPDWRAAYGNVEMRPVSIKCEFADYVALFN